MSRIALGLSSGLVVACLLVSCLLRPVSADPPTAEPSLPEAAVKKAPDAAAEKDKPQRSLAPTLSRREREAAVEEGAAADKADAAADKEKDKHEEKVLREQSIYIPYEKLRKVFEKEGRGVFLPYQEFQELWQAARDKTAPHAESQPPVAALITEAENEATVAKDVVRVKATLKIEVLAEGWQEIPLGLGDAAITSAKVSGQPARIVAVDGQGYKLLVDHAGKKPATLELSLEYAKAIQRMPGQNSVSFQAPQAPVSRWKVRIPEAGVKVNLSPLIAATEVTSDAAEPKPEEKAKPGEKAKPDEKPPLAPAATPAERPDKKPPRAKAEETVVLAFVGAAPTVRIDWTPKAEGATGLEALASVQAEQQVTVDEGVVRTRTQLAYTISRSQLGQITIQVPADQKVVNVSDANVRQWSVAKAGDVQTVAVQLFEQAKGSQNVIVELEKFLGEDKKPESVTVPVVKAAGVGRQQGVVVVQVAEGLRAETAKTTGLLQVDAAELPPGLARGQWTFAYRYVAVPFDLVLAMEKVKPQVVCDTLVEAELTPEALLLDVLNVYNIQRAGVFRLEMDLPAGYEVRQVHGIAAAGASAVQVDGHRVEGEKKNRLVVDLARKAIGRVALAVQLRKELKEPDLLTPTGKTVNLVLPIPQVPAASVERASGRVLVYAAESLLVNLAAPAEASGLRTISSQEALQGIQSLRGPGKAAVRAVQALAYTQGPAGVSLSVERRKPQVNVRQLLVVRVEDGRVKYQATFFYEILYSGVPSLRIDVPVEVAGLLHNNTAGIREKVLDPPPADLPKGYTAWSFAGPTELTGEVKIDLAWQNQIDKLDVGKPLTLKIRDLRPWKADKDDQAWGQIVLAKAETIDVHEADDFQGLRPIDPQHNLMPGAAVPGAAAAVEFHGPWSLSLVATRYDLKELKQTSIERAVLRMVVTRAEKVSIQALYRLHSAQQRLEVNLPAGAEFDADPRINAKPVTLEIGQSKQYYVPLVDPNPDQSFLLELRYTVPSFGGKLEMPAFAADSAVQKVYLCVYLPREQALVERSGPWTDEFDWQLDDNRLSWQPGVRQSDEALLNWVREGVAPSEFPTDGRLYVFSTLHPSGPLRLAAWDRDWLRGIVVALLLLGGVLLLPARACVRIFWSALLVVLLVFLGVFWPVFAWQVMSGVFWAAVVLVLAVWTAWYCVQTVPRALQSLRDRSPKSLPPYPFADAGPQVAPPSPLVPPGTSQGGDASSPPLPPGGGRGEGVPETPAEPPPEAGPNAPPAGQPNGGSAEGGQPHA